MTLRSATPVEAACVSRLQEHAKAFQAELDHDDIYFLNDATYLRFARARDGDVEKALAMMTACCKWRKQFHPHRITLSDIRDILALGTCFCSGVCRKNRPILVMTPGATNPFPAEKRIQLMVFILEETYRLGYEQLTWLFDFSKMGSRGKDDQSEKTRKELLHILQDYYPERLGILLMINTPWYMRMFAAIVWPFLDKRTKEKIEMNVKLKQLPTHIDPSQLLQEFGGSHVRDPQHDTPFPPPISRPPS